LVGQAIVWFVLFAIAFLVGSIPFGVIVGRLFYRSDLRQSGSGNIGAANALRSYGAAAGVIVLLLDALKGFAPTFVTLWYLPLPISHDAIIAVGAVLGHCYSPWLQFRGGKGVATWLGAIFGLSWIAGIIFVVLWLIIVVPTRYASLGSIVASLMSTMVLWFLSHDAVVTGCAGVIALLIIWKHRENIVRLREGRENKVTFGKASA